MTNLEFQTLATHRVAAVWAKFRAYYGDRLNQSIPTITLNSRLRTTGGRSFYWKRTIDLSTELFAEHTREVIINIIPHEVCHQVAWDIYQDRGHGPNWKHTMRVFGIEPKRCHNMINSIWTTEKAKRK